MNKTVTVDTKTFVRFWLVLLAIVAVVFFVAQAWTGLCIVGASAFLAIAMRPLALRINRLLGKKGGARQMAVASIFAFLLLLAVVLIILALISPVVVSEFSQLVEQMPEMFEKTLGGWQGINSFGQQFGIENLEETSATLFTQFMTDMSNGFGSIVISGVGAAASILGIIGLTLVLTLFFLLEGPKVYRSFWEFREKHSPNRATIAVARHTANRMMRVVSIYVFKQMTIGLLDGTATALIVFVLSLIFNFPSELALSMGIVTGVFYLIPMFGQVIGGTIVGLVLLINNPIAAIIFVVAYILYVQIENNIIAPKLQGGALKLSPLIILAAIVVGTYAAGLIGAIIAIPIVGCIKVFIDEYPNLKAARKSDEKALGK